MARAHHQIESELGKVAELAADLQRSCAALGISESSTTVLEICVIEAVNNAIEHAYGGRPGNLVEVSLELNGTKLTIEIRDTGTAMPPDRLAAAALAVPNLDDFTSLPERGMGLGIIKDAMDDVAYTTAHSVNRLSFSTRVELVPSARALEDAS